MLANWTYVFNVMLGSIRRRADSERLRLHANCTLQMAQTFPIISVEVPVLHMAQEFARSFPGIAVVFLEILWDSLNVAS